MTARLPAEPAFGSPLPIRPSPDTLELLALRRSSSAQGLREPGPNVEQVRDLLRLASRAPDHGKLNPWRFILIEGADKAALVEALKGLARSRPDPQKAEAVLAKLSSPPLTIAVISAPRPEAMPVWEQELSAGAVCALMLVAAEAMGFGANWITDWYSYDPEAQALLGLGAGERVAGFIHLGTPSEAPLERARPDLGALISRWRA